MLKHTNTIALQQIELNLFLVVYIWDFELIVRQNKQLQSLWLNDL